MGNILVFASGKNKRYIFAEVIKSNICTEQSSRQATSSAWNNGNVFWSHERRYPSVCFCHILIWFSATRYNRMSEDHFWAMYEILNTENDRSARPPDLVCRKAQRILVKHARFKLYRYKQKESHFRLVLPPLQQRLALTSLKWKKNSCSSFL